MLKGHTEVELIAAGYLPTDIMVDVIQLRNSGRTIVSLEALKVRMFALIKDFVRLDLRKYWPTFVGSESDLVYTFYTEKLMPKCRYNGKRLYFDGDYERARLARVPYKTLIDVYANTCTVSFETYVRRSVVNRLIDGRRGGIAGYDSAAVRNSVAVDIDHSTDSIASVFRLFSYQAGVGGDSDTLWSDAALASRLHKRMCELRDTEGVRVYQALLSYGDMRRVLASDVRGFMDYVFGLPDDVDDIGFSAWVATQKGYLYTNTNK